MGSTKFPAPYNTGPFTDATPHGARLPTLRRMSLLSLIIALALEQWRSLPDRWAVRDRLESAAHLLGRACNAGESQHGIVAWGLGVIPLVGITWLLYAAAHWVSPLLALACNVAVLYVALGFRHDRRHFGAIHAALQEGDLGTARRVLAQWRGHACAELSANELARLTMESALAASHRCLFGPIFWFVILPGPSGIVLYRAAELFAQCWSVGSSSAYAADAPGAGNAQVPDGLLLESIAGSAPGAGSFGEFSRRAFAALDWLPVRITATTFAIVGDFEDALYCWRTQSSRWPDTRLGVVLAAGAGALGVKLGMPIGYAGRCEDRPELGGGRCGRSLDRQRRGPRLARARVVDRDAGGHRHRSGSQPEALSVRPAPQRQQAVNCPSRASAHRAHCQTDAWRGAGLRFASSSDSARHRSAGSATCSSAAHSVNGTSPASRDSSSFLIQQPMPSASSTFLR